MNARAAPRAQECTLSAVEPIRRPAFRRRRAHRPRRVNEDRLFDHLIGGGQQRRRNSQSQRRRGLQHQCLLALTELRLGHACTTAGRRRIGAATRIEKWLLRQQSIQINQLPQYN